MTDIQRAMRECQQEIEAAIKEAHQQAAWYKKNVDQSWTVVCRINEDGDVSIVDGNTSSNYIWDSDGWYVVAQFESRSLLYEESALRHFRADMNKCDDDDPEENYYSSLDDFEEDDENEDDEEEET